MKEVGAFHSTVSSLDIYIYIYKDLFLAGDALLFLTMDVPLLRGITGGMFLIFSLPLEIKKLSRLIKSISHLRYPRNKENRIIYGI